MIRWLDSVLILEHRRRQVGTRVTAAKLQRWTDVLVALLRYQFGATFTQLSDDVPAYRLAKRPTEQEKAKVKRMFERDKAELLAFGVPIETIAHDGEIERYRLRPADFYLPYLAVVQSGRKVSPRRVDKNGYHSVQELAFEPDEISGGRRRGRAGAEARRFAACRACAVGRTEVGV